MADADNAFTHATDSLIALYRTVERRTIDLPLLSMMPLLILFWEMLKFLFGIFLVVPVNLVILIRNFFPGHWKFQPLFLKQLQYMSLWVWRGEASSLPYIFVIFVRPLFNAFVRAHFASRLRRLRLEILLQNEISDATRATLVGRIDAVLDRWKSPRLAAVFFTVLLPGIVSALAWIRQSTELFRFFGTNYSLSAIGSFIAQEAHDREAMATVVIIVFYLLSVPGTAFLAKRGLFIGRPLNRICFPGGQEGGEVYFKEREILAGVGLHAREARLDLWIVALCILLLFTQTWLYEPTVAAADKDFDPVIFWAGAGLPWTITMVLLAVAAIRRVRTGRL